MQEHEYSPPGSAAARPLRVLAVCGSMTPTSPAKDALTILLHEAAKRGAQTHLLDLYEADLPMFRPEDSAEHAALDAAREAVRWTDVFILATPDYHGSMSGALKNFLDHHWREFAGKLFGYVCSSHEKGLTAMDQMRTAVRQCYGWSLPYGLSFEGRKAFDDGAPAAALAPRLTMMARDLTVYGALLHDQYARDLSADDADTFAARYRTL